MCQALYEVDGCASAEVDTLLFNVHECWVSLGWKSELALANGWHWHQSEKTFGEDSPLLRLLLRIMGRWLVEYTCEKTSAFQRAVVCEVKIPHIGGSHAYIRIRF